MLRPIIVTHVNRASYLMTDESLVYPKIGDEFAGHGTVNHSAEEYVRALFLAYEHSRELFSVSSSAGSLVSITTSAQTHLHRYTAEFDFRYNRRSALGVDDAARAARCGQGHRW